jgi:hypothetical protein
VNSSKTLWKIPTRFFIGDSLCNWHDEQCSQFTNEFTDGVIDKINSVGNSVGKNDTSLFFLLYFNYFFPTVIPSVNTERIFPLVKSVGNLNISLVFLFVFIDFLLVSVLFGSVIYVVFQSVFRLEIHQNNTYFLFFKIYFWH